MFGFFDVIQDILSNLRTFGLRDVIDIAVVSLAMYQILLFARKSRAGQLVRGLLLLLVFYALADDHVRSIIDQGREHIEE